ncbi:MAG: ECF-type sigma factor [bacterium]|nr:ECF-type sigma factor [bacterium]
MTDVTRLLEAAQRDDAHAAEELLPLVYEELRKIAAARMAGENPGQTLQATALVHEAYLKLVGDRQFEDRQHFFRLAAKAMRQILVDRARRKQRPRHGGDKKRIGMSDVVDLQATEGAEIVSISEALDRLAEIDPVKAELVTLRFFAGMSEQQAADILGISRATASRYWTFARAWLINAVDEIS